MIIVYFSGGLGNQMFQYALGRYLSIKNHQLLKLDSVLYHPNPATYTEGRPFGLNHFNIAGEAFTLEDIQKYSKYYKPSLWTRKLLLWRIKLFPKTYYWGNYVMEPRGREHVFDPHMLQYSRKEVFLKGYWQSPKYFEGIEDTLRKDLTLNLKEPREENFEHMLAEITNGISVSLHIRRGDFLLPKHKQIYAHVSLSYYMDAITLIAKKIPTRKMKIYVFSDDIAWVKENLSLPFQLVYVSDKGFKDYQELVLMSKCTHNITANSTFSWWGAWLNSNIEKIVIAPKKWFADSGKNDSDLIPSTWIRV